MKYKFTITCKKHGKEVHFADSEQEFKKETERWKNCELDWSTLKKQKME